LIKFMNAKELLIGSVVTVGYGRGFVVNGTDRYYRYLLSAPWSRTVPAAGPCCDGNRGQDLCEAACAYRRGANHLGGEQILGASPLQPENSDKAVMQLIIDRVFQVRRDLDKSVAMATEFLRATPVRSAKPAPKPASDDGLIRYTEAAKELGERGVVEKCERLGWLKAVVRKKRLTLFRRVDVLACIARIESGDLP
jgi:hypothetical protein